MMSDQNDDKKTTAASLGDATISRRKLAYIAPLFISRRMIYRAAGCGKSDPRLSTCQSAPQGS
jgi:hypothetical protein